MFLNLYFHSHFSHSTFDYHLDNNIIPPHSHHKDLGIVISSDLSWNFYYDYISSRAYKLLNLLKRSFSSTKSPSAKKLLYISLPNQKPPPSFCTLLFSLLLFLFSLQTTSDSHGKWLNINFEGNYYCRLDFYFIDEW